MAFNNLKAEMKRMGYTQQQVADILGVSKRTVCELINGRTHITFQRAELIRDELFPGMTVDYLFRSY